MGYRLHKKNYLTLFLGLLGLLVWSIIRALTSLPKNVILDSYKWSFRFKYSISHYVRYVRYGCLLNQLLRYFIGGVLNQDVYGSIFPLTYLRIYRDELTRWNFNPKRKAQLMLCLAEGYRNPSVRNTVSCLTSDQSLIRESVQKIETLNMTTPYSPKIPHLTITYNLLQSPNDPGDDLTINLNQTKIYNENCMSKIYFTNGIIKPVYIRLNSLLKVSECRIEALNPNVGRNDSRVIYEEQKLLKIDYLVYLMIKHDYLKDNILIYEKEGYCVDGHFNEIFKKIDQTNLPTKFNNLNAFEKKCFAAVLISEVDPDILDILDLYEITNSDIDI